MSILDEILEQTRLTCYGLIDKENLREKVSELAKNLQGEHDRVLAKEKDYVKLAGLCESLAIKHEKAMKNLADCIKLPETMDELKKMREKGLDVRFYGIMVPISVYAVGYVLRYIATLQTQRLAVLAGEGVLGVELEAEALMLASRATTLMKLSRVFRVAGSIGLVLGSVASLYEYNRERKANEDAYNEMSKQIEEIKKKEEDLNKHGKELVNEIIKFAGPFKSNENSTSSAIVIESDGTVVEFNKVFGEFSKEGNQEVAAVSTPLVCDEKGLDDLIRVLNNKYTEEINNTAKLLTSLKTACKLTVKKMERNEIKSVVGESINDMMLDSLESGVREGSIVDIVACESYKFNFN